MRRRGMLAGWKFTPADCVSCKLPSLGSIHLVHSSKAAEADVENSPISLEHTAVPWALIRGMFSISQTTYGPRYGPHGNRGGSMPIPVRG